MNLDNMLKVLRLQIISPHVLQMRGLIFGAEDYVHSAGLTRTPSLLEMAYARQKVVAIAKAWDLEAFDLVPFVLNARTNSSATGFYQF